MIIGLDDVVEDDVINSCFEFVCFQYLVDVGMCWVYYNFFYCYIQELVEVVIGVNFILYICLCLGNVIGMKGGWFGNVYYSKVWDMVCFGLLMLVEG